MNLDEEISTAADEFITKRWNSGETDIKGWEVPAAVIADKHFPPLEPKPVLHDDPNWLIVVWILSAFVVPYFIPSALTSVDGEVVPWAGFIIWNIIMGIVYLVVRISISNANAPYFEWRVRETRRGKVDDKFQAVATKLNETNLKILKELERKTQDDREREEALRRPKPIPGCTHQQAEFLAALWMRYLGELDAKVSQATRDGGIDVESSRFVAEVKHHMIPIGPKSVRALAGVAFAEKKGAAFFSLNGYTKDALKFGRNAGVIMFTYDPEKGELQGATPLGRQAIAEGLASVLLSPAG